MANEVKEKKAPPAIPPAFEFAPFSSENKRYPYAGRKNNAKMEIPTTSKIPAPGQCIILKTIPVPESNAATKPANVIEFFMVIGILGLVEGITENSGIY